MSNSKIIISFYSTATIEAFGWKKVLHIVILHFQIDTMITKTLLCLKIQIIYLLLRL